MDAIERGGGIVSGVYEEGVVDAAIADHVLFGAVAAKEKE